MNHPSRVSGTLRFAIVFFGALAALAAGTLAAFTVGETYALVTAATIVITSVVVALTASPLLGRLVLAVLVLAMAGSLAIGAYGAMEILAALSADRSGPVDAADPDVLASAERKIEASVEDNTFRVELTERELNAVLQDALAETDTPFQRITIDILNTTSEPALIGFTGDFKNGRLSVDGQLTADTSGGQLQLELLEADVGMFTMPGVARDAVEDMIGRVADLNRALAEEGADVQSVVIGDDVIVVTGVASSEGSVDAGVLLASFGNLGGIAIAEVDVAPYAPGVDTAAVEGDQYYVALGDSLAAAVGVDGYADGYVSQVHRELSLDDGIPYGLRNFGISGETSGTMLLGSQLDDATAFGRDHDVEYVTIDIGANDLLGHLASSDCSEDIAALPCASRIDASLQAYAANLDSIFSSIEDAFGDAEVVFLLAYNPFSLGFEAEVAFEAQSNDALASLNDIAVSTAAEYGFVIADGFSPMRGTATATTHMTNTARHPPKRHRLRRVDRGDSGRLEPLTAPTDTYPSGYSRKAGNLEPPSRHQKEDSQEPTRGKRDETLHHRIRSTGRAGRCMHIDIGIGDDYERRHHRHASTDSGDTGFVRSAAVRRMRGLPRLCEEPRGRHGWTVWVRIRLLRALVPGWHRPRSRGDGSRRGRLLRAHHRRSISRQLAGTGCRLLRDQHPRTRGRRTGHHQDRRHKDRRYQRQRAVHHRCHR
ncbi:MAG: GDSL-type esterase/lipase family protein [Acidimicrobiia bacterium]|nr:GDSL-type esterase/lipase family protein [Acidimicrobiia bacterium]